MRSKLLQAFPAFVFFIVALASIVLEAHPNHSPKDSGDSALLGALYPQIAPNGEAIAYAKHGAIWKIDTKGGVAKRLSRSAGYGTWPTWSPNGKRIAYINGRGSHIGPIQLIDSENGKPLPTKLAIAKHKLAFSPDGKKLLSLFNKQGKYALRWCDIESGELSKPVYPDSRGLRYALSCDGRKIALATAHDVVGEQGGNNGPQCDLWIMSAEGGEASMLLEFPGRVYDVAWNASGDGLFVVSNVGGAHNDLWEVPLEQPMRGRRKLTFGQADEDTPSVDAAGRFLLFSDNRRGPTMLTVRDMQSQEDRQVSVARRDFQSPTGGLAISVFDADTGKPTTARLSIRDSQGRYYAPPAALYRMLRGEMHFYCSKQAALELPVGDYTIKAARGPEYVVMRRKFTVESGQESKLSAKLRRWTNQRAQGWYSGESHIHANYGYGEWYNSPRTMLTQSSGEDLVVSNFMVANSEADGVFDREFFLGRPDPLSTNESILYWNEEFRSTIWGHLTLLNLKQLVEPIFTGFARTTHPHDHPTNADIADHTHDQDGHVNYTHPAHNVKDPYLGAYSAKALPLDVALGKVDSMDVMGATAEANMEIWYRLLNCGFRVPASAGTDCFLNRVRSRLPGQVRVYVHVEDPFNYQRWIDSLRAGRTFVTDGPMIRATVNDKIAGSELQIERLQTVRVKAKVESQWPLDRLEVVYNGKVLYTVEAEQKSLSLAVNRDIHVGESGWIAVRVRGPSHPDQPTGKVFAHTSPVYVNVAGHPRDASEEAAYFVAWIDRLRADIRKRNRIPMRHQEHVESQIAAAREVFNRLLDTGGSK